MQKREIPLFKVKTERYDHCREWFERHWNFENFAKKEDKKFLLLVGEFCRVAHIEDHPLVEG